MKAIDESGDRQTVLVAGSTGTLGGRIAHHLLQDPNMRVRLLVRAGAFDDPAKKESLRSLEGMGAGITVGELADRESLLRATEGADIVVSAVQGGRNVIVDGQLALARAAYEQGVWRIVPSDFALDLFAASPGEHPAFDLRREADEGIAELGIGHVHVLNGAFLDGMVHMGFDHAARTVSYWGTGDEVFEATTVEDTARFTARAAADRDLRSGPLAIVGDRVSANGMTDTVERVTGAHYTRRSNGSVEDLRARLEDARARGDIGAQTGAAYLLYMATGQTRVTDPQNDRYPDIDADTFDDVARRALAAG